MKKKIFLFIIVFAGLFSCTDLEPTVYTEIVNSTFFKTEKQFLSAAGPAYSSLNTYTNATSVWGMNSLTTDEMLIPTRGIHWFNDGIYQRFHKQEWISTDFIINNGWKATYGGITNCNRVIFQYEQIEDQSETLISIMNELKGLRAYLYYQLLDLYGNVPIVTQFEVPDGFAPANNTRKQVFDFVKQELENAIPVLNNTVDMTTYGRFHRYVAFTTLAKLYLNADVFVGEEMWDQAIAACDSVIKSGVYSLSEDYFENFAIYNESSKENIFVIPFTNVLAADWGDEIFPPRMFQHHLWTLHFNGGRVFGTEQDAWDGMCAVPSFYNSYDELDIRRTAWLSGIQLSLTGDTLKCNQEKNGQNLDYTPSVTSLENAYENEGVRIAKYDYTGATNFQLENDFVLFRYADVLLMKAEALMRKNGGAANQEAVDLVNQIRERAFPDNPEKLYTTSTLTLEALLAERGWEFAGEGIRRNDLIRFGKYNDPADFRPTKTSDIYNLFPIPQDQINANPNLTQNPGY